MVSWSESLTLTESVRRVATIRSSPPGVVQTFESAVEYLLLIFSGASDGLFEGAIRMADGNRLKSTEAGLHHAALVIVTGLGTAAQVREVDFHSGDTRPEM